MRRISNQAMRKSIAFRVATHEREFIRDRVNKFDKDGFLSGKNIVGIIIRDVAKADPCLDPFYGGSEQAASSNEASNEAYHVGCSLLVHH